MQFWCYLDGQQQEFMIMKNIYKHGPEKIKIKYKV